MTQRQERVYISCVFLTIVFPHKIIIYITKTHSKKTLRGTCITSEKGKCPLDTKPRSHKENNF